MNREIKIVQDKLDGLVNSVMAFFCSDELFEPKLRYDRKVFELFDTSKPLTIRVCDVNAYFEDIDLHNEDSYCHSLSRWFDEIGTWAATLREFDVAGSHDRFDSCFDILDTSIESSKTVRNLAARLHSFGEPRFSYDNILDNLVEGVVSAAQHIIDARIIFLGERFGLTEAIFEAYKDGLLPFGYDRTNGEVVSIYPI